MGYARKDVDMSKEIEVKKCARCGEIKPVSEFNRHYNSYQPYCRDCQKEYNAIKAKGETENKIDADTMKVEIGDIKVYRKGDDIQAYMYGMEIDLDDLDTLIKSIEYIKAL
jgi:hypothetical protein